MFIFSSEFIAKKLHKVEAVSGKIMYIFHRSPVQAARFKYIIRPTELASWNFTNVYNFLA